MHPYGTKTKFYFWKDDLIYFIWRKKTWKMQKRPLIFFIVYLPKIEELLKLGAKFW